MGRNGISWYSLDFMTVHRMSNTTLLLCLPTSLARLFDVVFCFWALFRPYIFFCFYHAGAASNPAEPSSMALLVHDGYPAQSFTV